MSVGDLDILISADDDSAYPAISANDPALNRYISPRTPVKECGYAQGPHQRHAKYRGQHVRSNLIVARRVATCPIALYNRALAVP